MRNTFDNELPDVINALHESTSLLLVKYVDVGSENLISLIRDLPSLTTLSVGRENKSKGSEKQDEDDDNDLNISLLIRICLSYLYVLDWEISCLYPTGQHPITLITLAITI